MPVPVHAVTKYLTFEKRLLRERLLDKRNHGIDQFGRSIGAQTPGNEEHVEIRRVGEIVCWYDGLPECEGSVGGVFEPWDFARVDGGKG